MLLTSLDHLRTISNHPPYIIVATCSTDSWQLFPSSLKATGRLENVIFFHLPDQTTRMNIIQDILSCPELQIIETNGSLDKIQNDNSIISLAEELSLCTQVNRDISITLYLIIFIHNM